MRFYLNELNLGNHVKAEESSPATDVAVLGLEFLEDDGVVVGWRNIDIL